jgi:cell division protein ZapA
MKVNLTLYGRDYAVNCAPEDEKRLREVVTFVNEKMARIASNVGNTTEARLFMLTCLTLADEIFEMKTNAKLTQSQDEELMTAAVDHLSQRITALAGRIGHA